MKRTMRARITVLSVLAAVASSGLAASASTAEPKPAPAPAGEGAELPFAGGEGSDGADAIADRVQAFYDKSRTFQAEFKQR